MNNTEDFDVNDISNIMREEGVCRMAFEETIINLLTKHGIITYDEYTRELDKQVSRCDQLIEKIRHESKGDE